MLRLVIVSPSGELSALPIFPGEAGAFTVLPGHAPLVSGLAAGEIVYAESDGGEEHRLGIAGGFVRVLRDEVEACVEVNDEKY